MHKEENSSILFETKDKIAYLTINRPEAHNAQNHEVKEQVRRKLELVAENADIRVAIITGAGKKAFSAGADLDEIVERLKTPGGAREGAIGGQILFNLIEKLGKPVIAAINGYCLGGGCELALACTIRIASTNARFGLPEIHVGTLPGHGGSLRLLRLVGKDRAAEMIITGDMIDAQEAYRIGLVTHLVSPEDLIPEAEKIANRIIKNGEIAVRLGLEGLYHAANMPFEQGLALEASLAAFAASTEDSQKRLQTIIEKRK